MFKQARRMELSKAYIHTPFLGSIWWLVLGPLCLTFSMFVVGFLVQDPAKEEVRNGDVKEKETGALTPGGWIDGEHGELP